jgi:hypothetical protein
MYPSSKNGRMIPKLAQGVFESPNWIFKYRIIRLDGA